MNTDDYPEEQYHRKYTPEEEECPHVRRTREMAAQLHRHRQEERCKKDAAATGPEAPVKRRQRARHICTPEVLPPMRVQYVDPAGRCCYDGSQPLANDEAIALALLVRECRAGPRPFIESVYAILSQTSVSTVASELRRALAEEPAFRRRLSYLSGLRLAGES